MSGCKRGDKTICIPVETEAQYESLMENADACRSHLLQLWRRHPELLPAHFEQGFRFHSFVYSRKLKLRMRRIELHATKEVYQLRPDFVMPYMVGRTEQVEKGLYLCRFGVPFDGLAYVLGRNGMYWYRAYRSLGRCSIVGSTIKAPEHLPEHLLADEKHTWWQGQRVYVPTTVAHGCILGASLTTAASTKALRCGYQEFVQEAQVLQPAYRPQTVNTDGWEATQQAWLSLFPTITVVRCFLHQVLKLRRGCRRLPEIFIQLSQTLWHIYHAATKAQFSQRLRRFYEWSQKQTNLEASQKLRIRRFWQQGDRFSLAYDYPDAYRTSAHLDRLMNYQDRLLFAMQYFHGTQHSARLYLRSMALLWNFHPYGSRTRASCPQRHSPFGDLNGFCYHDNWLRNLLLASSMNGRRMAHTG